PWDCLGDRRGRGGERGPLRRQHEGGESRGLRPVSSSEQRADGSRAVPASTALHEERAPLRRVSAHVDGNRRAAVHRGRKRTTAARGRRPGAGGLGGRPETEDAPRPVAGSPIDVSGPPSGMRPMRIIVCIKQVPKAQELQVDPVTQTLKRVGVPSEINPPDANALEIALTLKDRHAAEVVVLSMGPTSFDESLERAVAMGADRSVLLTERILGGSDTVPTAYALSETIQKIGGYDLILTGEETTDASTGHVGPGIAGHLDLPQITYVSEVRIVDNTVRARRTAEDGTEWWQTNMPSLCTVNFGCNKPRSPTLTGKIRVKRGGVIVHWSCADVGIDPKKVGLLNSPTIVAKVDTIRLPPRAGRIFSGDAKESVRALLDALLRARVDEPMLEIYRSRPYAQVMAQLVRRQKPEIVLFGASKNGRDLGGRLHAILETGLAADCVKFDIDADGNLDMIRPSFGGKSLAHILCKKHRPQMASVRRNVFVAPPHNPDRRGEIVHERVELSPQDLDARLLEFDEFTKEGGLRPEEADIVVSGGYGLGDPKNFQLLQDLADRLGGAIAASRKAV